MTIERAVVKGLLGGLVGTRNMLVADVVESGGDTSQILWGAYLTSIYDYMVPVLSTVWTIQSYELQNLSGSQWVPFDEIPFTKAGTQTGDALPNAVAVVLLGKAAGLRHIGRKFFSGIPEVNSAGNSVTGVLLTAAANATIAYITPFTGIGGGTITPGVLDKTGTFHAFVGGVVSSLFGSMRRRKPGIGI